MKTFYHATPAKNAGSILASGLLPSADGYVYLAERVENAIKFLWSEQSDIWIFAVRINKQDERNIEETFDHSREFFDCRVYGYCGSIPPSKIKPVAIHHK